LRVHNKETPVMATAGGQSIDNRRRAVAGGAGGGGAANLHLTEVPEQPVSTSKVVVVL